MESNPMTTLYRLRAKRPFWTRGKGILPGDRTAVRPDRQDGPDDRWLILRVALGDRHMGTEAWRQALSEWEEVLISWLNPHPTAMWDGHEWGRGEFVLYLLTPSPGDLWAEIGDRSMPVPPSTRAFGRFGPQGVETMLAQVP